MIHRTYYRCVHPHIARLTRFFLELAAKQQIASKGRRLAGAQAAPAGLLTPGPPDASHAEDLKIPNVVAVLNP